MIVIDASALLAIYFNEPESQAFEDVVTGAEPCALSAVNAHEVDRILRARHGPGAVTGFWDFLRDSGIAIFPFDEVQLYAAAEAFHRYGKGIHPKARLNLADCAAYALAKSMNAPRLFKGGDFAHTDVEDSSSGYTILTSLLVLWSGFHVGRVTLSSRRNNTLNNFCFDIRKPSSTFGEKKEAAEFGIDPPLP